MAHAFVQPGTEVNPLRRQPDDFPDFLLHAPHLLVGLGQFVGGMRRKPVECVRGQITGLPFPANSEIVFEGFLSNDNRKFEGPFGEWTGHYQHSAMLPVVDIVAIYHRNDPILLGVPPMGGGSDEMSRYRAVMRSAMIKQNMTTPNALELAVPDADGVHGLCVYGAPSESAPPDSISEATRS